MPTGLPDTATMRAMAIAGQGAAMVVVPKPEPGADEVRVKVVVSAVNPADEKVVRGAFSSRFLHAKASPLVIGWDFAGTVDARGQAVTEFEDGAPVWGHLAYSGSQTQGTYAEYVTVPRSALAAVPEGVPLDLAAAAATIAMSSLQASRDHGRLGEGGRALIIGAGGGVGSMAVGIAKRLGGHVTAVCSARDIDRVRGFGADVAVDRERLDQLEPGKPFDVVFDTPAVHWFGRWAKYLRPGGTYVTTLPNGNLLLGTFLSLFTRKRCRMLAVASRRKDLETVGGWLRDGLQVPIDSHHKVADLETAFRRQTERGRGGRVVVEVADGWPVAGGP